MSAKLKNKRINGKHTHTHTHTPHNGNEMVPKLLFLNKTGNNGEKAMAPHCSTQCSYYILSFYFIFLILSSLKSSQANLIHRVGFHMGGAYLPTCQSERTSMTELRSGLPAQFWVPTFLEINQDLSITREATTPYTQIVSPVSFNALNDIPVTGKS